MRQYDTDDLMMLSRQYLEKWSEAGREEQGRLVGPTIGGFVMWLMAIDELDRLREQLESMAPPPMIPLENSPY